MESHASATAPATAGKKRKLSHHQEADTKDNEDEEMEEFFALVRSIREARDRLRINGCSSEKQKLTENSTNMKRKLDEEDKRPVVEAWKPTFQREDFLIEDHPPQLMVKNVSLVSLPSSSQNKETTKQKADQEIKDQGLDLTLSL